MKLNRKGQARYEGMVHKINPDEVEIVKRIFTEFAGGKSIHNIAAKLNEDGIPTKRKYKGGWNTSSLSRILKNQKYAGIWNWRNSKFVKDPMSGKKKKLQYEKLQQEIQNYLNFVRMGNFSKQFQTPYPLPRRKTTNWPGR